MIIGAFPCQCFCLYFCYTVFISELLIVLIMHIFVFIYSMLIFDGIKIIIIVYNGGQAHFCGSLMKHTKTINPQKLKYFPWRLQASLQTTQNNNFWLLLFSCSTSHVKQTCHSQHKYMQKPCETNLPQLNDCTKVKHNLANFQHSFLLLKCHGSSHVGRPNQMEIWLLAWRHTSQYS